MQSRTPRIFLYVFFVSLFFVPSVMRRLAARNVATKPGNAKLTLARYGFTLEEAAEKSGLHFAHIEPKLDPKLDHIMSLVASMGAAVSVVDYDKDGLDDIFVTNSGEGSRCALYHNLGNGKFEEVAAKLGVADLNQPGTGACMGAVWGDYDNDGYEDLLVYKWGRPELFHNDSGKGFTRVTEKAGLPSWVNANAALWLDYDRDGKLDLLICGYYNEKIDLWHLKDTHMMPNSFEYASNGGRKFLLRNRGDGTFEDVTEKVGLNSTRWTLAAVAADLRGTGYPDIFLANDYGVSEIFVNEGGKHFQEVGKEALYWNISTGPKSGMNASLGDIFNQGKFSIYVSNISEPGQLVQGNNLWVPKEGAEKGTLQYANMAHDLGVEIGGWSFGAQFGDLNNDGTLDLFLTNGNISGDRGKDDYWYSYSLIAGGNASIISDAKNWPPMAGKSLSGYQQKCVWINDGAGKFTEVAQAIGVTDQHDGRSVALGDFENNGALDVVVANQKGPLLYYHNTVNPDNRWIEFALEGTRSNRSAIGAQVHLTWNGQTQVQEVSGGSGFCAQNQRRLHFGLGKAPKIEKVVIRWPSGQEQTLANPEIGKINQVKEPQ